MVDAVSVRSVQRTAPALPDPGFLSPSTMERYLGLGIAILCYNSIMGKLKNEFHEKYAQHRGMRETQESAYLQSGLRGDPDNAHRLGHSLEKRTSNIRARIMELQDQNDKLRSNNRHFDRSWVLERLKEQIERCMQIKEMKDKRGKTLGVFKWEASAANKAIELAGRELGMFATTNKNLHGEIDPLEGKSPDELRELVLGAALKLGLERPDNAGSSANNSGSTELPASAVRTLPEAT